MTKKLNYIISLILVVIFMTPMIIKLFDGLFHHHNHIHCTAKNEKYFHEHHDKCPIPNFELSSFSVENHKQIIQKHFYHVEINDIYNFLYCCNNLKYSFLLRAPPIFTNRIIAS